MGAIYLVRHGQAAFGAADYDQLSRRGFEQSTVAGAELRRRRVNFAEARMGSLARQRDTAATVLAELGGGVMVKEDPRWNEYDHVDIYPDVATYEEAFRDLFLALAPDYRQIP